MISIILIMKGSNLIKLFINMNTIAQEDGKKPVGW